MSYQIEHIKGAHLDWPDLWNALGLTRDKGGRWYAGEESPEYVRAYCSHYRTPSRAWPFSHAKPLLTQKFAKKLVENDPALAVKLRVAREVQS